MIRIECRADVDLVFHLLAHLDPGRDAANLFAGRTAPWTEALHAAYEPRWQWMALSEEGPDDAALLPAIDAAAPEFMRAWRADAEARHAAIERARAGLVPRLERLRNALGATTPLRLLHCPSLRHHGRALTERGLRTVATSLDRDLDDALCTVLHEECHPISDPTVPGGPRNTRAGTAGFARHRALEDAAVALGLRIVRDTDPGLLPAYHLWCARYGY